MAVSQILTFGWQRGTESISKQVTISSEGAKDVSVTIAAGATNTQVALAFVKTRLKSIIISSDETLTLKTNSSGSPDDTITITADTPYVWHATMGITNPFAGDVTTTYWSNAGASAAALEIHLVEDATP